MPVSDRTSTNALHQLPQQGEFEKFVAQTLGQPLARFGSSLFMKGAQGFAPGATTTVPPDYALNPGDELLVGVTGSVDAPNLRLIVDNDGRIFVPHVGAINVAGVRYGDLQALLTRNLGQQYRNFTVSVTVGHLHGVRVYVTGYAMSPGAYTVSSLSTLVNAVLAAGGPSSGGSFRQIELRRNGHVVTSLDLYDLLLKGDKTRDAVVQNEDVIYIGPVGTEVAVTGSVNAEAIYEAKPGETLGDILRYAGGSNTVADERRIMIFRQSNFDKMGWQEIPFEVTGATPVERGDIVRVLSTVDIAQPLERQAILATIDGEVQHPGHYYLKPGSTMTDLLAAAGGLTPKAFLFGTELDRTTVREQQKTSFNRAIQNFEFDLAAKSLTKSRSTTDYSARIAAAKVIVDRLRDRTPSGRLVLSISVNDTSLPGELVMENDDRLHIPSEPTTIGVSGAVYQDGSYRYRPGMTLRYYLKLSGDTRDIADRSSIFVVRANGAVISDQNRWFSSVLDEPALPGDLIFVPVDTSPGFVWEDLKDAALVIYELGLGAASVVVLTK